MIYWLVASAPPPPPAPLEAPPPPPSPPPPRRGPPASPHSPPPPPTPPLLILTPGSRPRQEPKCLPPPLPHPGVGVDLLNLAPPPMEEPHQLGGVLSPPNQHPEDSHGLPTNLAQLTMAFLSSGFFMFALFFVLFCLHRAFICPLHIQLKLTYVCNKIMLWLNQSVKSFKREILLSGWNFSISSNIPGGTLISPGASPAGNSLQPSQSLKAHEVEVILIRLVRDTVRSIFAQFKKSRKKCMVCRHTHPPR